ncbi:MAG: penicillin-binding protein 2 [Eubacteriales bacterium]
MNRTKRRIGKKKKSQLLQMKMLHHKVMVLFGVIFFVFVGLSIRIIYINAESGDTYKKQILSQQQYNSSTIPYERGEILDANYLQLATSIKVYNVILDAKMLGGSDRINDDPQKVQQDITATINALKQCFGIDESTIRQFIIANPNSQYYRLARQQDYDSVMEFQELQANATSEMGKIFGIWFEDEYTRYYPNGSLASNVIGVVSSEGNGSNGLEQYYNTTLNGIDGREYGYLNDNAILERTTKSAINGNSIVTSIDLNIQKVVEKYVLQFNEEYRGNYREGELGSNNTGVIIMDPNCGEILAMASYPNYDLNNPTDLMDYYTEEEIEQMDEKTMFDEVLPAIWKNFCISSTYEPGSTAKLMTVATGLEYGRLLGNECYTCYGSYEVSGHPDPIHCANRYGHGELTFSQAIEQSCNVALMNMGMSIGIDTFMKGLDNYHIGLKTNIDLVGEERTDTVVFDVNTMVPTDLAIASFGQGYNTTMIQMATIFSSLINGGYYYEPHVVSKIMSDSGTTLANVEPRILKQTVSAETSAKIIEYCDATVLYGTGAAALPEGGYTMGGKTGTAETLPRGTEDYVVSFIGYAPAENPEVLIYVVVDRPNVADQARSSYAMEIAKNIMTEVLPYMSIFPTEAVPGDMMEEGSTLATESDVEEDNPQSNEDTLENGELDGEISDSNE